MSNAFKAGSTWECWSCGKLHADFTASVDCCGTVDMIHNTWACGECVEIYKTREEADECCSAYEEDEDDND